jgi:hypothetical protein
MVGHDTILAGLHAIAEKRRGNIVCYPIPCTVDGMLYIFNSAEPNATSALTPDEADSGAKVEHIILVVSNLRNYSFAIRYRGSGVLENAC